MSNQTSPLRRRIAARLGLDLFVVLAIVFVGLRLLDVHPWTATVLDLHTYWLTREGFDYHLDPYTIGAYLYAPVFAQVLAPLTALPWPVFAAIWTALIALVFIWISGRWAMPLLLTGAVTLEFFLGQIDVFIAAAILVGFRYPAVWAFPLLTKVAPGIGLVWFAVRREWRNLAIALGATVAIAAVSAVLAPEAWRAWLDLLRRSLLERQVIEGTYLAIPIWLRLPIGIVLIAWGAKTDRHWTLPVGVLLSMPILWINVFTLLIAVVALRPEFGRTPARDWLIRRGVLTPDRAASASPAPAPGPTAAPSPARAHDDRFETGSGLKHVGMSPERSRGDATPS